ncbi:hypothetical protein [Streptacidiphilus sp. PAMC 29251]
MYQPEWRRTRSEVLRLSDLARLRLGDLNVTEVCFAAGYSLLGTLSSRFTQSVVLPPSAFRHRATSSAAGLPPCAAKQVTHLIRNQEAPVAKLRIA